MAQTPVTKAINLIFRQVGLPFFASQHLGDRDVSVDGLYLQGGGRTQTRALTTPQITAIAQSFSAVGIGLEHVYKNQQTRMIKPSIMTAAKCRVEMFIPHTVYGDPYKGIKINGEFMGIEPVIVSNDIAYSLYLQDFTVDLVEKRARAISENLWQAYPPHKYNI